MYWDSFSAQADRMLRNGLDDLHALPSAAVPMVCLRCPTPETAIPPSKRNASPSPVSSAVVALPVSGRAIAAPHIFGKWAFLLPCMGCNQNHGRVSFALCWKLILSSARRAMRLDRRAFGCRAVTNLLKQIDEGHSCRPSFFLVSRREATC